MMSNPYQYLNPVTPEAFVARWPLVKRIALDLTLEGGNSHSIIAGRRCGKSSVLIAITHQLCQATAQETGDWQVLPIPFDFKSGEFSKSGEVYVRLLREIVRRTDANARRRPSDAWPHPISLEAPWFGELVRSQNIDLHEFEDGLDYVLQQLSIAGYHIRLIFLIDEFDDALDKPWTEALFNQLRWLVCNSDIRSRIRFIFAGSHRFLDQVNKRGSPLWNVLKLHYLEPFDELGFAGLVHRASELNADIVSLIWLQSGGHPFIAQYFLHHLWDDSWGFANITVAKASELSGKFISEQIQDVEGWAHGVDVEGFHAYSVLVASDDWIEEQEILRAINNPMLNIKRGLLALCYHGLANHDDGWSHYRRGGDLFKTWFTMYGRTFLASQKEAEQNFNKNVQVSGDIVIFSKNAQVQQDQLIHEERINQMTYQEKVVNIGDNNTISAPIVIAESVQNSFNTLKDAQVDNNARKLLEDLLREITEVNRKIPPEKSSDAESMARDAESLVKEASSSKPRRRSYEVSFEGLKQAAINIGELASPVLEIVRKLMPLLLSA